MIYSEEKKRDMEIRSMDLECAEIALRMYARTKKTKFLEFAKYFGKSSRNWKKRLNAYK